jgi:hypothetical protein
MNARRQKLLMPIFAAALTISLLGAMPPARAADKQPNIVLILMDNLGYGELGVYGSGILRGAPTPRIDSWPRRACTS